MGMHRKKTKYLASVSGLVLAGLAAPAMAQDADDGVYLGEIVLSSSKRDIETDSATPITRINQEEIYDRQASTVAELIDSVPGVSLVNGTTPIGSGINIRGFGANGTFGTDQKVLILIDGATTGAEEIYRIGNQLFTDPALYKNVSVIRGTVGSFEYGSGVVGGVVQLETKDASDFTGGEVGLRFRQTLHAASNGPGFSSSSILAWQPTEQLEVLLHYQIQDRTGDLKDGAGATIPNSEFRLPSFILKGKYRFGDDLAHSITASYNSSSSVERDKPYDSFGTSAGAFGNVDRDIDTQIAALRYQYQPVGNDLVDLDVNLTYSDQKIDQSYVPGSSTCDIGPPYPSFACGFPFPETGFGVVNADHRYETTKLTVKNTAFFSTGAATHELRAGVELSNRKRLDAASAPGGTDRRVALFVVDNIDFGNGLTLTPAARYETQKIDGDTAPNDGNFDNDALMGGLSARYEFDSGFAVFASAAYTESLPIIDDLGNPAFIRRSEKARTFEAGMSYSNTDVFGTGDVVRAKANFYRTNLWDVTSYSGVSTVEMTGLELEASYATANGLYVDLNGNVVDGKQVSTSGVEGRFRGEPANSARLAVGKRFNDAWDANWELVTAVGGFDSSSNPVPGYGVNNIRATYRPQSGVLEGTEFRFAVENVFDQLYQPSLYTRNAPGRNFKLTVAKTF